MEDNETTTINIDESTTTTTSGGGDDSSGGGDDSMSSKTTTTTTTQLNADCLEYIQKNSTLISNSLSFLFDVNKRETFFKNLSTSTADTATSSGIQSEASSLGSAAAAAADMTSNSLNRFIQLYVPLEYMKHMSMQSKLNMITQFLLTNKTDESKIELIIDLANYYAQKQEWHVVMDLLNGCTQDSEELFNDLMMMTTNKNGDSVNGMAAAYSMYGNQMGGGSTTAATAGVDNLKEFLDFNRNHALTSNIMFSENCSAK